MMKTRNFSFIDILMFIVILFLLTVNYLSIFNTYVNICILAFFFILLFIDIYSHSFLNKDIMLFISFVILSLVLVPISHSIDITISKNMILIRLIILTYVIFSYCKNKTKITNVFNYVIVGNLISCIIILVFGDLASDRMTLGNADINTLGIQIAYCSIFSLYYIINSRGKIKFINLLIYALSFITILLTGSRSAFLSLLFSLLVSFLYYSYKKKRNFQSFLILAIISVAAYLLIINIPIFYDAIGVRFKSLFEIMKGKKSSIGEGSAQERLILVKLGLKTFFDSPIWGYGLGTSGILTQGSIGWSTFFHNNFIELLAGGGLLLFIAYYLIHYNIVKRACRLSKNDTFSFPLVLILTILFSDIFLVKYYLKTEILFLMYLLIYTKYFVNSKNESIQENIGIC